MLVTFVPRPLFQRYDSEYKVDSETIQGILTTATNPTTAVILPGTDAHPHRTYNLYRRALTKDRRFQFHCVVDKYNRMVAWVTPKVTSPPAIVTEDGGKPVLSVGALRKLIRREGNY